MAKYVSQFIPTDFNQVGNLLGMYRQDMQQRDQQFDAAVAAESEILGQIGSLPTADIEGRNQRLSDISKQMEEAVQRRGGDYRLAAKDLQRIVAKERANPWYQLNQKQLEQSKLLEQALARNPNLHVLQDPRNIKLSEVSSPDEISYSVLDPETYQKVLEDRYKTMSMKRTPLGIKNLNGYDIFQTQVGLSNDEIANTAQNQEEFISTIQSLGLGEEVMNNPEIMQSLYNQYSGYLGGLNRGIVETKGMSPYDKFRMQEAMRESGGANKGLLSSSLPVSGSSVEVSKMFDGPSEVQSTLRSKDANAFKKERAEAIIGRALSDESVQGLLTPQDIAGIEKHGDIFKYLEESIKGFDPGHKNLMTYVPGEQSDPAKKSTAEWREYNRIDKLKNTLEKAIEFDLEEQSFDFYGNMYDLNPLDPNTNKIKSFIEDRPLEGFQILTGDMSEEDNEKDLREMDEYKLLQKGMSPVGYGYDTTHGTVFRVKDNEGNSYLVRPHDPTLTNTLIGLTGSQAMGELEKYHNVDFEGNTVKYGNLNAQLPFEVNSKVEKGPDGRSRRYYTIPELTYRDFYDDLISNEYESLIQQGHKPEEVSEYLTRKYSSFKNNLSEKNLNKPYKTSAKSVVMDIAKSRGFTDNQFYE